MYRLKYVISLGVIGITMIGNPMLTEYLSKGEHRGA